MKSFSSGYVGNPELWIDFICSWQRLKGRDLKRNPDFDTNEFVAKFPFDAPESYKHFMAARKSLSLGDFLPVVADLSSEIEEVYLFSILNLENVECLALHDKNYGMAFMDGFYEETLPMILASDECRDFSKNQCRFPISDGTHRLCNYVVAEYRDIGNEIYVLINPLLRSEDGEWTAWYFSRKELVEVYFKSFAHLVAYIYMHDVVGFNDMSWRGIEDDTLGYSRVLFSDA